MWVIVTSSKKISEGVSHFAKAKIPKTVFFLTAGNVLTINSINSGTALFFFFK